MTDFSALATGLDLSHYQGQPDWGKLGEQGLAFVILKATQGGSVDPEFDRNRQGAVDAGISWLPYPFLTPNDGQAAIDNFRSVVGDDAVPAALDWEEAGVPASVVEAWIGGMRRVPLMYYGLYPPAEVTPTIARCPRWFPQYPGSPTANPRLPAWNGRAVPAPDWTSEWLIWQWSDTARVAGIGTAVDADRLAVPAATFQEWYRTGVLLPLAEGPAPAVVPPSAPDRILRLNSMGDDVVALQHMVGVTPDGVFGPETQAAVRRFQSSYGLAADGVVGPRTAGAISAIIAMGRAPQPSS